MLLHRGCTWLTLMPLLLSLSTGELGFYRDALPETSEDVALKHLARYLEAQRLHQRLQRRSHLAPYLSPVHKKHREAQEERALLEALTNKVALENLLRQKKLLVRYRQYPSIGQINPDLSDYDLDLKLDYIDVKPNEDDRQDYRDGLDYGYKARTDDVRIGYGERPVFNVDRGMIEEPMVGFHHGRFHMERNHANVHDEDSGVAVAEPAAASDGPKFTYKFDDSNLKEEHPFAVKPNDPRYYSDAPFSWDQQDSTGIHRKEKGTSNVEERFLMKHEGDTRHVVNQKTPKDSIVVDALVDSERSAVYHPSIVPMNHELNNDIYFIAIVAGCSAAAMFALVLISLTWCRLQRGAKAAADIEYPAYGVTGPNKDVSPSGDQRLAQSAQMYHFQHQKQQIIAMENRTSATRDPGSLSEAESDEENEEGDYTVYECPGLASTGEMEVKNPMFHDDPTPATPAQSNNKEEDHI